MADCMYIVRHVTHPERQERQERLAPPTGFAWFGDPTSYRPKVHRDMPLVW